MSEGTQEEKDVRWLKVEQAKASISAGLYDGPEVLDVLIEAIFDHLSK